ncbi:GAF domain-containing protein [Mucilaginibacter sp. PAMB04274]|uniref:GAF domain-containing protein n=1 Tax=Mucilaginibacter sp. PAMB04274 TaxID=3138568 RepID=UPI0031F6F19C
MLEKENARLRTVSRYLNLKISKEQDLQQIVELAGKISGSPIAMITIMDGEAQYIKFSVGTDIREVPLQDTICQHAIVQKQLLVIPDILADERVMHNPFAVGEPGLRFYAGSPLITHDDQHMGTLCVYDLKPKELTDIQKKLLHRMAKQVTRLLEFEASIGVLNEQYHQTRAEETKLRSFFESSSSCHLLLDRDLRVVSFNKALSEIMKNSYGMPISEGVNIVDYVNPGFVDEFTRNCYKALTGDNVRAKSRVNSPEGDLFWYISYEPTLDQEGNITGVSYCATDITQTVQHEKKGMMQEESFQKINHILSTELHQPLNAARDAMAGLKLQGYPDHLTEFYLLEQAFQELAEKTHVVLNNFKQ